MNRNIVVIVSDGENDPDLLPDEFERLINLATRFKSGGGTIACVGVRAAGHGFRLLRGLATPGFFINVFGDAAAVAGARASLLGSLGQICASSSLSIPGPQYAADKPLPSLEIFGNDPPADLCVPALAKSLHRVFFGAGEVDPFFGTSEYRALTPHRADSIQPGNSTLIRWTVPDLTGEFIVRSQHLSSDMFSWTVWCNTVDDITTAKPVYISSSVLVTQIPGLGNMIGVYVAPCNFLWPVSWGGPPPVQPAAPVAGTAGIAVPGSFTGSAFIRLPGPTIHFT